MATPRYISDTLGDDLNNGSAGAPYATLQSIFNEFGTTCPDDIEVYLARGDDWFIDAANANERPLYIIGQTDGGNLRKVDAYGDESLPKPRIWGTGTTNNPTTLSGELFGVYFDCPNFSCRNLEIHNVVYPIFLKRLETGVPAADYALGNVLVELCKLHDCVGDPVQIGVDATVVLSGRSRVIRRNEIYRARNDGISLQGTAPFEVYENYGHSIGVGSGIDRIDATSGDAITAHSGSSGHLVYSNYFYDVQDGLDFINQGVNPSYISGNFFGNCRQSCLSFRTVDANGNLGTYYVINNIGHLMQNALAIYGVGVGDNPTPGGLDNWTFYVWNNLIVNDAAAQAAVSYWFEGNDTGTNVLQFYNNASQVASGAKHFKLQRSGNGGFSLTMNRNAYNSDSGSLWTIDASNYNLAGMQGLGHETNSVVGDFKLRGTPSTDWAPARGYRGSILESIGQNLSAQFVADFRRRTRYLWNMGPFALRHASRAIMHPVIGSRTRI